MANEKQQEPPHNNPHDGVKLKDPSSTPPKRLYPHELCNSEYVSRLVAATPPFLYSAPVGANNFYFSDMLRSIGHVRNSENIRNLEKIQQSIITKRQRKRAWSQHHRPYLEKSTADLKDYELAAAAMKAGELANVEKPLELTNKMRNNASAMPSKYGRHDMDEECLDYGKLVAVRDGEKPSLMGPTTTTTAAADMNSVNTNSANTIDELTLQAEASPPVSTYNATDGMPVPAPLWYPPYFPAGAPYGVDPLHFFIDLRVSGHICDRQKREAGGAVAGLPPLSTDRNNKIYNESETLQMTQEANMAAIAKLSDIHKYRQGSAFTVPKPRGFNRLDAFNNNNNNNDQTPPAEDVNVTSCEDHLAATKENQPLLPASFIHANKNAANANYMLQKLPQMYSRLAACNIMAAAAQQQQQHGQALENEAHHGHGPSAYGLLRKSREHTSNDTDTEDMQSIAEGNIAGPPQRRPHSTTEQAEEQDSNIIVENDSNESRGSSNETSNNN